VVQRQRQPVVRPRLPRQLRKLPKLPHPRHERRAHRDHRLLPLHVLVRHIEPGVVPDDRPLERQKRQIVVEVQVPQPMLPHPRVQPRIVRPGSPTVQIRPPPEKLERPPILVPSRLRDEVPQPPLRPSLPPPPPRTPSPALPPSPICPSRAHPPPPTA